MESPSMLDCSRTETVACRAPALLAVALLALLSGPLAAQSLYCCKDDRGRRLCADRLPAQCVGKPHTVRSPDGRMRSVAGWLTPEQRKAKEEEALREKLAAEVAAEQARLDRALLATYGNESDIDAALAREESALGEAIKQAEKRIEVAAKRRQKFEQEAEFYKRKELPEEVRRGMRDADYEIKAQQELIDVKRSDLAALQAKYADEKKRYLDLTTRANQR